MSADGSAPRSSMISLAELLDEAVKDIEPRPSALAPGDGFLFSGNRHESVPRRLFLDRRLTPLERNAWQVFRLMLNDDGVTAFPTYEQLRPWLASMPCSDAASHETVARALTLLRLTRWLSLVRRCRDAKTGRIVGNLYVLHDEPLTPFEAMQLDPSYLELVSQSLNHAAKAVRIVGLNTLREIANDPLLSGRTLPSRLQILTERLAHREIETPESYSQEAMASESEEGELSLLRNLKLPCSESEVSQKPSQNGALRSPKKDRTVRSSSSINEVRTTARVRAVQGISLPDRFHALKDEQQFGALMALQQVDPPLKQAVLDEWVQRCHSSSIRNPAGYLFGIIQRAIRGEFNAWAKQATSGAMPSATEPKAASEMARNAVAPEVARQHIERLRELLRRG